MKGAIQEERFEYKGFTCVILMQAMAFRTGYVAIPKGHELYHIDYNDISICCHGGLTYSRPYLVDQNDEDTWWIGFDTGHYGDGYDYDVAIDLFKDYPETVEQINRIKELNCGFNDYFMARSLQYCKKECEAIVDQIIYMNGEEEE